MGNLLKWVGAIWALLGAANIFLTDSNVSDTTRGFGLIFNMLLFIIPGLILAGIGAAISKKTDAAKPANAGKPVEARLQELAGLHESGVISASDYEARKQEILRDL